MNLLEVGAVSQSVAAAFSASQRRICRRDALAMLKPRYLEVETLLESGDWRLVNVSDAGVILMIAWEHRGVAPLSLQQGD